MADPTPAPRSILSPSTLPTPTDEPTVTPPSSADADAEDAHEAFSNLKDERNFEEQKHQRKAKLVMGPPLGEAETKANEIVIEGEELKENESILAELEDDAEDLELTHLRLRTLRGLGLERFRKVQRISLRQNLLSSLSFIPLAPVEAHTLSDVDSPVTDEVDEDSHDDEDAKQKEEDFEYREHHHSRVEQRSDTVWPLRNLAELEEIDLYDNRIKSVKGLEGLVSLKSLDLSFNLLRSISPLDDDSPDSPFAYPLLDHLYLIQNKLSKIEGVRHRTNLVYLEFGGNRIRTLENLPVSANLRSLFLGKNKITKIQNLEGLTGLRTLSLQSNRITKIEGLEHCTQLEELYLSHNGLTKIEGLSANKKLTTLDVGNNKIVEVDEAELAALDLLEEFWANDNQIENLPILPPSTHPNLETIYLEGNPLQKTMATTYRRKIMIEMPQVKQIDATFTKQS